MEQFVKKDLHAPPGMFEAEAEGLREIAATKAIRTPAIIEVSQTQIVLERLELQPLRDEVSFAEALVTTHSHTQAEYGWHRDNFIGPTPQSNKPGASWPDFFRDQRLLPLLRQLPYTDTERFLNRLDDYLGHQPKASLLHGDLWSGNVASLPDGQAVIFDPAVHYGDFECDLAMLELFGSMSPAFYEVISLSDGFKERRLIYQLYHLLNHDLLFGGSYYFQAARIINSLA